MAPIVAPEVTRFTVNGTYAGQPVANVIDVVYSIVAGSLVRGPANLAMAERLEDCYKGSGMFARLSTQLSYSSTSWVDISSLDGDVGEYTWAAPGVGSNTSGMPGNVALRWNKTATGQRGARPGKMYIPGLGENDTTTSPNEINTAGLSAWQAIATEFYDLFRDDLVVDAFTVSPLMVIVRTRRPTPESDPIWVDNSNVTALTVQQRVASQRRRLTL